MHRHLLILPFFLFYLTTHAQKQYQGLLWEITGNGMEEPSYLYGTMHVSDKVAFYLGEPFFDALESVDQVALELEPEQWFSEVLGGEMMTNTFRMLQRSEYQYFGGSGNWNMLEGRMEFPENTNLTIQQIFRSNPSMINQLLFRFYDPSGNFEEETWLDMYIYQSAVKLGKETIGLETFDESMGMMRKAQEAIEKNPRDFSDYDMQSRYEANEKIEDAYRKGDLDRLDSLSMRLNDKAYTKYILIERNKKFIEGMDSLMQQAPLFTGVGAAHLPGEEGCIEMLRDLGYTVVPVRMGLRDAKKKEKLSESFVKRPLRPFVSEDARVDFDSPYEVYEMSMDLLNHSFITLDIANGLTFIIDRFVTNNAIERTSVSHQIQSLDSMLFEIIPGEIIQQKEVSIGGMRGLDILHEIARGDINRAMILFSPQDVVVARLSGSGQKIKKGAGDHFFSSLDINLHGQRTSPWRAFRSMDGSLTITLPGEVADYMDAPASLMNGDRFIQSIDAEGDVYRLYRLQHYDRNYIEDERYLLYLAESAFEEDNDVVELDRKNLEVNGQPALQIEFGVGDDQRMTARFLVSGNSIIAMQCYSAKDAKVERFMDALELENEQFDTYYPIVDSAGYFRSTIAWEKDTDDLLGSGAFGMFGFGEQEEEYEYSYEVDLASPGSCSPLKVTYFRYPRYEYLESRDDFLEKWDDAITGQGDLVILSKDVDWKDEDVEVTYVLGDSLSDYAYELYFRTKGNSVISIETGYDQDFGPREDFQRLIEDIELLEDTLAYPRFIEAAPEIFLMDIQSEDSAYFSMANERLEMTEAFPEADRWAIYQQLVESPSPLASEEDKKEYRSGYNRYRYLSTEIGLVDSLILEYQAYSDSAAYQVEILTTLLKTREEEAIARVREILTEEAPIGVSVGFTSELFSALKDSLEIYSDLYPELLELLEYDEYKEPVLLTLKMMLDSAVIDTSHYTDRYDYLLRQSKLAFRRLSSTDFTYTDLTEQNSWKSSMDLFDYLSLLRPFTHLPEVEHHFEDVGTSSRPEIRKAFAHFLTHYGESVSDSAIVSLLEGDALKDYGFLKNLERTDLWSDTMDLKRVFVTERTEERWSTYEYQYSWDKSEIDSVEIVQVMQDSIRTHGFTTYYLRSRITEDGISRPKLHVVMVYDRSAAPDFTALHLMNDPSEIDSEVEQWEEMKRQLIARNRAWMPDSYRNSDTFIW
ncbi:MAG: TraB/GumN family protein [Flavobacteriales bacterium]|nr:TraB/GumN family protein [Flavobacteriales bacterium]